MEGRRLHMLPRIISVKLIKGYQVSINRQERVMVLNCFRGYVCVQTIILERRQFTAVRYMIKPRGKKFRRQG